MVGSNKLRVEKAVVDNKDHITEKAELLDDNSGRVGGKHKDELDSMDGGEDGMMAVETKKCEFKRGVCTEHKLKGDKMVNTTKKWQKKKAGYGWVTIRRVTYTCSYRQNIPLVSKNRPGGMVDSQQRVQGD